MAGIQLTFDQTSSNTGPRDWRITYSTTGDSFTDSGFTYSVLASDPAWSSSTYQPAYSYSFDLSDIEELNNQQTLFLRLVDNSTVSANGGTVMSGGTSRLDNVTILGTAIGLPGDFNNDGKVDAADYIVWRKTSGTQEQYNTWRENFGRFINCSGGSCAGSSATGSTSIDSTGPLATVPEPSMLPLLLAGMLAMLRQRGRR